MAAAGSELTSAAITPGSVPHGERQNLEAGLSSSMGGTGGQAGGPPGVTGAAGIGPNDPLGAALTGEIPPGDGPVTSGLSVGPGPGSSQGQPQDLDLRMRLVAIAESAKSPVLRTYARIALRNLVTGQGRR